MIDREQVLALIRENGPLIPRDIVKVMGADTFIVGAVLSTLVDSKTLKISSAKIGGSPVYYLPGQEEKLEKLYPYLNEKDRRAYDLLKGKKIFRDREGDPLLRVSLRAIKDFAKPLEVASGDAKEIFWKWHLVSNQEAEKIIRSMIGQPKPEQTEPNIEKKEPEIPKPTQVLKQPEQIVTEEPAKKEPVPEKKEPEQEKQPIQKKEIAEQQKTLEPEIRDDLFLKIKKLFSEKNILLQDVNVIRKNSDIECILIIPSPVGNLKYFCKIRDKKKTNDKDLSSLFVDSQVMKLPALYVTTGDLTKKAEEKLERDFRLITVMRV